jgi:undecaprenyl-diphosphatase
VDLRKAHPHSLSPRVLAIAGWTAFALSGVLFLLIAWNVSARGALAALDTRLADWLHAHAIAPLTAVMLAVTHLNSTFAIGVWSAVFAGVLARLRERYWILTLGLAVGGAMLLNLMLKQVYERARPRFEEPLIALETFSFPSGHTAAAVAFYGVLAAFLVSRFYDTRRRAACVGGALAAVALVAFSRLYLGAHYLSDVVAAVCSSTAWLVLCLAFGHALVRKRLKRRWIVMVAAGLAMLALGAVMPLEDWSHQLEDWSHQLEEGIAGMGLAAGIAVFCAASVFATLLLVPAWIFPLVAGAVFGMRWGLVAAMIAAVVSALAAFLLARYLLRALVERAARRNKLFKSVDGAVKKDGWKVVALLRMSPVLPSGFKSYFLGLTHVKLRDYVTASAAGMLPGIVLKVYVGAAGRGAITEGGALNWTIFAAGVAATIALTMIVGRKVRAALKL